MRITTRFVRAGLVILGLTTLLTACGGGGGGGGTPSPIVSTDSFSFATANAAHINNGYALNFNLTGTQMVGGVNYNVTGSGTVTVTAATPSNFEGQPALLNTETVTGTITVNGVTAPLPAVVQQSYSTTNYVPLGEVDGNEYWVMQGTPVIPATVKVGDTAVLGTFTRYTDSGKATVLGTVKLSYVIEADAAHTAIINLVTQQYDTLNALEYSDQTRWRIDTVGTVTFVSEIATSPLFTYTLN